MMYDRQADVRLVCAVAATLRVYFERSSDPDHIIICICIEVHRKLSSRDRWNPVARCSKNVGLAGPACQRPPSAGEVRSALVLHRGGGTSMTSEHYCRLVPHHSLGSLLSLSLHLHRFGLPSTPKGLGSSRVSSMWPPNTPPPTKGPCHGMATPYLSPLPPTDVHIMTLSRLIKPLALLPFVFLSVAATNYTQCFIDFKASNTTIGGETPTACPRPTPTMSLV